MNVDILIPTCKQEVNSLIKELLITNGNYRIISTCLMISAAQNRNAALSSAKSDIVIMMDDDMTGFYPEWLNEMIEVITGNQDIILLSARLLHPKGFGHMGIKKQKQGRPYVAQNNRVSTACFALRRDIIMKNNIKFDENFVGSGYEDTDFMMQISQKLGKERVWINDNVELMHNNEMKNQGGPLWEKNHKYYRSKWPDDMAVVGQQDWTAWR